VAAISAAVATSEAAVTSAVEAISAAAATSDHAGTRIAPSPFRKTTLVTTGPTVPSFRSIR
jgi:hypothetical protein